MSKNKTMKREIKFRAFDKKEKVMIYNINLLSSSKHQSAWISDIGGGGFFNPRSEDYIVLQYTGLKDKNGKEIYEGDILKSSYTDFGHQVIFKDGAFRIEHSEKCCPPYKTSLTEAEGWQEIIGNIYENPELLNNN